MDRNRIEQLGLAQDRQKLRLENIGRRAIARTLREMNRAVIAAYMRGNDPIQALNERLPELQRILERGMIASHLDGHRRALMTAAPMMRTNQKLAGTAYDEAIDFLTLRLSIGEDDLRALELQYGPTATQQISRMSDRANQEIIKALRETTGLPVDQGVGQVRAAMNKGGLSANPWAVETVFRTNTALAYSAGRMNANADPAIQEILWGYEYLTVGDDRVRPTHAAMDGTRLPKDDAFWKTNMPPNGWNCRCVAVEVFDESTPKRPADEVKLPNGETTSAMADQGWRFNPGDLYSDYLSIPPTGRR